MCARLKKMTRIEVQWGKYAISIGTDMRVKMLFRYEDPF